MGVSIRYSLFTASLLATRYSLFAPFCPPPQRNPRQRLVEVHRPVLLAVSAEADDVVGAVELGHVAEHLAVARVEAAQEAIEAEHHVDAAETFADILERAAR